MPAPTCTHWRVCFMNASPAPSHPGDSAEQQIAGHLILALPRPTSLNPAIPAGFDEVIARGMAKQPTARFSSAGELASAAKAVVASFRSPTVLAPGGGQPLGTPSVLDPMAKPGRNRIHPRTPNTCAHPK